MIQTKYNLNFPTRVLDNTVNRLTNQIWKLIPMRENNENWEDQLDKILIEFYMTYHDALSVGDKIVFFSALKGTIKRIYPKGKEPRSEFRKNETLKSLLPLSGVNARMVGSVPILTALNKVIVELDRAVKDIYGIKYNDGLDN